MKKREANKPNILFFDIETSPNLAYVWGKYEQNVLSYQKEWELLSFAWKWKGESTVHCSTKRDTMASTDKLLVMELWKLMNEADIIVAHYGDAFDIKKSNAKFLEHGLIPPKPYLTVDTKKIASRHFALNSNKLDDIGKLLKVGRKMKHEGFELWLGCLANNKKSWATMAKYNKQDVILLEKVYEKLLPWINNHPNVCIYGKPTKGCPNCGGNVRRDGYTYTKTKKREKFQCQDCMHHFSGSIV